jgi:hypothetical protein
MQVAFFGGLWQISITGFLQIENLHCTLEFVPESGWILVSKALLHLLVFVVSRDWYLQIRNKYEEITAFSSLGFFLKC